MYQKTLTLILICMLSSLYGDYKSAQRFFYQEKYTESLKCVDAILEEVPNSSKYLLFKAETLDKLKRRAEALALYEKILELEPMNQFALRKYYQVLLDLGALSILRRETKGSETALKEEFYHLSLKDELAYKVRIFEMQASVNQERLNYQVFAEYGDEKLSRNHFFDFLHVLKLWEKHNEILSHTSVYAHESLPLYVQKVIADAYLASKQPVHALGLYQSLRQSMVLEKASYNELKQIDFSIFYCLNDLQRYKEAETLLQNMEKVEKPFAVFEGLYQENPFYQNLLIARGGQFFLNDQLSDAEEYFKKLFIKAPANLEFIRSRGDVYYSRGWPSKAYDYFAITANQDDTRNIPAELGKMKSLEGIKEGKPARALLDELLLEEPQSLSLKKQERVFALNDGYKLQLQVFPFSHYELEFEGHIDVHQRAYIKRIWSEGGSFTRFRDDSDSNREFQVEAQDRVVYDAGVRWHFNRYLALNSGFHYFERDNKLGAYSTLTLSPDDHWSLSANYTDKSLQVPIIDGLYGRSSEATLAYRFSDTTYWAANANHLRLNDDNALKSYYTFLRHRFYSTAQHKWFITPSFDLLDWKFIAPEYYSPDWMKTSLELEYLYLISRRYDFAYFNSFAFIPSYKVEDGFDDELVYAFRYRQDWDINDQWVFQWSITYGSDLFYGEESSSLSTYFNLIYRFP